MIGSHRPVNTPVLAIQISSFLGSRPNFKYLQLDKTHTKVENCIYFCTLHMTDSRQWFALTYMTLISH